MKKRVLAFCLVLCMIMSIALTGCGAEEEATLYDYDLSEYITLGQYKGIEVEEIQVSVADDEVQAEIQTRLREAVTTEAAVTGTVADGDLINIDYKGIMDGVAFQGGTAEGADLSIGSGQFIPGFESGLIGTSVGDTKVLNLNFPDPYENNPDMAGKAVEFTVKVNYIQKDVVPEYNLDFVKANSDSTTIADYEKSVKADLYKQKEQQAQNANENYIWSTVVGNAKVIKYPEKEKQAIIEQQQAYYESYAQYMGADLETMLTQSGSTMEEFNTEVGKAAEQQVLEEMVVLSIARAEGIELTDEEYDDGVLEILQSQGIDSKEVYEQTYGQDFEEAAGKENLELTVLFNKVIDFLVENSVEVPKGTLNAETTTPDAVVNEQ